MSSAEHPAAVRPTSRRGRRIWPIVVPLVLVAGLVLGLWFSLKANVLDVPQPLAAPHRLAGLALASELQGEPAVQQMERLHGKDVGVVDGYVAQYQGPGEGATVWVGQAESEAGAARLLERMTEKMKVTGTGFRLVDSFSLEGTTVYSALGEGGQHYYYRSGDRLIWVSFDSSRPLELLKESLRLLR